MAGSDDFIVLYAPSAPTDPVRLGQLFVDETNVQLKICTSLSPVTYTALLPLSGGTITGDVTFNTVGGDLHFLDNVKAFWGTGDDLSIYHDGTNSIINNATGNLIVDVPAGSIFQVQDSRELFRVWDDSTLVRAQVGNNTETDSVVFDINAAAGEARQLRYMSAGVNRWVIATTADAETGSNAGSWFDILARQDDGTASYTLVHAQRDVAQIGLVGGVGTTTNPNWGFISDLNTGVLRPSADHISLVAGGTEILACSTSDVTITGNLVVTGSLSGFVDAKSLLSTVSITSNTTYANIGELVSGTLATGTYIVEAFFATTSHATPDMKRRLHFTGTATDISFYRTTIPGTAAGAPTSQTVAAFDTETTYTTTGQNSETYQGTFTVTASGVFSYQAAQITSSATSISVDKGSWFRITKVA